MAQATTSLSESLKNRLNDPLFRYNFEQVDEKNLPLQGSNGRTYNLTRVDNAFYLLPQEYRFKPRFSPKVVCIYYEYPLDGPQPAWIIHPERVIPERVIPERVIPERVVPEKTVVKLIPGDDDFSAEALQALINKVDSLVFRQLSSHSARTDGSKFQEPS